ncbi:hypothetical protein CTH30272_02689 [Allocatenococcus thiocycli]|nr:hypothetical protein CTH30272_02681 [Catenococcus thiocycli]CAH0530108.1 hypothetical protein CTH30272_02684 [Catenococcus thiocycli]CAH0530118.1 hypothetical protein CTH30272_02689 [Catenococcus thiocycli]
MEKEKTMAGLKNAKNLVKQARLILMMVDSANGLDSETITDCIHMVGGKLRRVEESISEHSLALDFDKRDLFLNLNNQAGSMLKLLVESNALKVLDRSLISNCLWSVTEKLEALNDAISQENYEKPLTCVTE